ncbi:MAG: hypothetical protein IPP49_08630 [Saprospiraceae bacterium]|nr:hypothetical protein [Saprospiraceae bacterium]
MMACFTLPLQEIWLKEEVHLETFFSTSLAGKHTRSLLGKSATDALA